MIQSPIVDAKTVSGDFRLSGVNTEHVLATFAVDTEGAIMTVEFKADKMYENEQALQLRIFRDSDWPAWLKSATCTDKIRKATQSTTLSLEYKQGTKKWTSAKTPMLIVNAPDDESETGRPHYWYFVVDDCSLEQYLHDAAVPELHYELTVLNYLPKNSKKPTTHLSADEMGLTTLHTVTLIWSFLVAALLFLNILMKLSSTKATIHVAVLAVALSAALDAGSSLFELIHLKRYEANGIGSYFADALSAHFEALCDAVIMLLLLSLGAGWTLPGQQVIAVQTNSSPFTRFCMSMASPIGSFFRVDAAGIGFISVIVLHTVLAQWGRTYNDDFESYHDLEHLPGQLLMAIRIVMGLLMLVTALQTRWKCQVVQLQSFYAKLTVLSVVWFWSLPAIVFLCSWFVPYYLRHPAVFLLSAIMQSSSLTSMAWLVTSHTSVYHKYSRLSIANQQEELSDCLLTSNSPTNSSNSVANNSAAGPTPASPKLSQPLWKIGKAKIRCD